MTRLDAPLKRELLIQGRPYRLTISRLGLHLARKGRRKGCELAWLDFVNGDAALARALNASLSPAGHKRRPRTQSKTAAPLRRSKRTRSSSRTSPPASSGSVSRQRRGRASSHA